MNALWHIFRLILREQRTALLRGALLGIVVLAMGTALLGLSGWFITAAAAAGLAGMGGVFDVFRPSAMVRMLALGRAASRYGERLLTHDATLRALETLRLRLLGSYLAAPYRQMQRIRGAQALNRLMADVEALDGVPLRLLLPAVSAIVVQASAFAALWLLVGPVLAAWITGGWVGGAILVLWRLSGRAAPLSRQREAAAQTFRTRLIDMIRARRDLAIHGELQRQADAVRQADARRMAGELDRLERRSGFELSLLGTCVAAGTLWLGLSAAQTGLLQPALAVLAFFVAVALGETVAPLRRAGADLGRMAEAARRVRRDLPAVPPSPLRGRAPSAATPHGAARIAGTPQTEGPLLAIEHVSLERPGSRTRIVEGLTLEVAEGETVALTGPSGCGKSSVLLVVAGLLPAAAGRIVIAGRELADYPDMDLRATLTLVPQRSTIMAGSVADSLRLADPDASDDMLWRALQAVELQELVRRRGGLGMRLGHLGEGFSGGETRRLALARSLLRQPKILLLDEPTEGLDDATAHKVLDGIRGYLPAAAVLMASHRQAEKALATRIVALG